jgi:hypothetical protein
MDYKNFAEVHMPCSCPVYEDSCDNGIDPSRMEERPLAFTSGKDADAYGGEWRERLPRLPGGVYRQPMMEVSMRVDLLPEGALVPAPGIQTSEGEAVFFIVKEIPVSAIFHPESTLKIRPHTVVRP